MKNTIKKIMLHGTLACALALLALGTVHANAQTNDITAIDILLLPDATMIEHAEAVNARLRGVFPEGFALDASHHPHISMYQCYVRTSDLDKVYATADKVLAAGNITDLKLKAFKYYYLPDKTLGLSGIVIEPTPALVKLQEDLIAAVAPLTVKTATSTAFVTGNQPVVNPLLIKYVEVFATEHAGKHFEPHVTTGLAPREYLDKMLAEPFADFSEGRSLGIRNVYTGRKAGSENAILGCEDSFWSRSF